MWYSARYIKYYTANKKCYFHLIYIEILVPTYSLGQFIFLKQLEISLWRHVWGRSRYHCSHASSGQWTNSVHYRLFTIQKYQRSDEDLKDCSRVFRREKGIRDSLKRPYRPTYEDMGCKEKTFKLKFVANSSRSLLIV